MKPAGNFVLALTISVCSRSVTAQQIHQASTHAFSATLDSLINLVRRTYVDSQKANAIAAAIDSKAARDRYARASTPQTLAQNLTRDLYTLSRDKHFAVTYNQLTSPPSAHPSPEVIEDRLEQARRSNFG